MDIEFPNVVVRCPDAAASPPHHAVNGHVVVSVKFDDANFIEGSMCSMFEIGGDRKVNFFFYRDKFV